MHIYGTSPSDMQVYFSGQELTNGEKTVAELGIAHNSLLVVKVRQHLPTQCMCMWWWWYNMGHADLEAHLCEFVVEMKCLYFAGNLMAAQLCWE